MSDWHVLQLYFVGKVYGLWIDVFEKAKQLYDLLPSTGISNVKTFFDSDRLDS